MGTCSCFSKSNNGDPTLEKNFNRASTYDVTKAHENGRGYEIQKITIIQAHYRGHKSRQKTYKMKLDYYKDKVVEQLHAFAESMTHNAHHHKLPPFVYEEDEADDAEFYSRVFKPATELAGGGVYVGEW